MGRTDFTLHILGQNLRLPYRLVSEQLAGLERIVNEAYAGTPLTWDLRPGVLALAEQALPAPEGYRWEIELREGNQLLLFIERKDEIPDGYRWAASVITSFDGGHHPNRGDLWACKRCGALILPDDQGLHDRHHAEIDQHRLQLAG